jgi:dihydrolipoamide dehydrogenase
MADTYDVVVIGGGPGGYNCAIRAGQLGLRTACVEKEPRLGGTCLNVGCIPSKALLHASEVYEAAGHEFAKLGVKVEGLAVDLPQMLKQKDEAVEGLTKGVAFLFKKNNVDHVRGTGRIASPGVVEVKAEDGAVTTLNTRNIVIATGSEVTPLPGVPIDETRIVSSTGALKLQSVPKKLVVVGAGIIGLELGSVWRRLGAEVTVVEFLDRITPGVDGETAKALQRILQKQGITFRLGTKVAGVDALKTKLKVRVQPAQKDGGAGGDEETLDADVVLVAIGRRPYTAGLGLQEVGVVMDKRGFIETDHFKTNVEGVWAIGDCIHGPMLAHKAEDDGVAAAELIAGKAGHVDWDLVPGVIYTSPEVAWVGATEEKLKEQGIPYKAGKFPFTANSRARTNHETEGFVKVLAHAETDEILGVHMIGKTVGEMIAEAALAMAFRASSEDVARTCHPHPTLTEAVRQASMAVEGWAMQM